MSDSRQVGHTHAKFPQARDAEALHDVAEPLDGRIGVGVPQSQQQAPDFVGAPEGLDPPLCRPAAPERWRP